MSSKNPGIVSDTPFKQTSVTRSDLSKSSVSVPVKGGMKVVNTVSKDSLKRR